MVQIHHQSWHFYFRALFWLAAIVLAAALPTSISLTSISATVMVISGIFSTPFLGFSGVFRRIGKLWWIPVLGCLFILSGFISGWTNQIGNNLFLILIPFSIAGLGSLTSNRIRIFFSIFAFSTLVTAAFAVHSVVDHIPDLYDQIKNSKEIHIPTNIHHITFSSMQAFGIIIFGWMGVGHARNGEKWKMSFFFVAGFISFCLLHVLSARTGIISVYLALLILGIVSVFSAKNKIWSLLLIIFLMMSPYLAYRTIRPLQVRVHNSISDLERFWYKGEINNYSFSQRLEAWQTGLHAARRVPLMGFGPRNVKPEMLNQYELDDTRLWPANRINVHNAFLFILLSFGFLGLIILLAGCMAILNIRKKGILLIGLCVILGVLLMVESVFNRETPIVFLTVMLSFLVLGPKKLD